MDQSILEQLIDDYTEVGLSVSKLSKKYKKSLSTIYDILKKSNVKIRKQKIIQIPRKTLYNKYIKERKTIKEISQELGCSYNSIRSLLTKYNIKIRIGKPLKQSILTKEVLYKYYCKQNLTIKEVAKKLGFTDRYISDSLKRFGIKRKRDFKNDCKNTNLVSKTVGRLTVGRLTVISNDEVYCQCRCICGNITRVTKANFMRGLIKSCGCARAQNYSWVIPPYILNSIKRKAKLRGIAFNLSNEFLESLYLKQNKKCAISGVDIFFSRAKERLGTTASLDRINSKESYIENNVQWIHKELNKMKNTLPNEDFIRWCKIIGEYNK